MGLPRVSNKVTLNIMRAATRLTFMNQEEIDKRLNECDQVLSDGKLLGKNVREQRCGTNQTFSCPDCEFTSQKNDDIKKHKLKHRKRKRCCSLCGFISKDKADFELHKEKA